ncbi:DUF4258 domain-containing protein [Salinarimonas sp.]|uniref:DUF4258 domain-containing protein n=1 Tax=Salinarimonas sp. TaxID=2766526 RepID=UPI0032D9243E
MSDAGEKAPGGAPVRVTRSAFKARVSALLADGRVKVSLHLRRDHPERQISLAQIERCLRLGTVQTDPYLNRFGNWQAEIYRHLAGEGLTVVAALEWERQIIVVTAYR